MAENSSGLICRTRGKRFIKAVGYKRHLAICGINHTGDPIERNFVSVVRNEPASEHQQPKVESGTVETDQEHSSSHDDLKYTKTTDLNDDIQKHKSTNKLFECAECSRQFFHKRSLSLHISKVHRIKSSKSKRVKDKSMVCKICSAKYKLKKAFLRHVKNCKEQKLPIFECLKCKKQFCDKPNLVRHENTVHQTNKKKMFQCSMCEKSFNRVDNFKRHLKSCKNRLKVDSFICYYCGSEFSRKNSIKLHILRQHWIQSAVECETCGVKFKGVSSEFALKRHIREYHIENNLTGTLKCSLCVRAFFSRENILCHLVEEHDITLSHTHLSFASMDQFKEWKVNLEKSSLSFYRNRRGFTQTKNYSMSIYECHRSGCYRPKTDRKRRIKLQGTKKIGCFCPAEMSLCVRKSDGTCRVAFTNTHLGHRVGDENELAYLSVPRDERAQLALKISSGLSYDQILKEHTLTEKDRLYLLTRKDLNNISRAFNVKEKVVECSKEVDIDVFAEQHRKSILLRHFGESDSNDPTKSDFFMIVMTEKQKEVLRKFGSKVISLDGTFSLNCEFLLLTLLVVDDWHEAVPVAFGISSRKDFSTVDAFVARIRQEVGPLKAELFASDVEYDYYGRWRQIMGASENRPFCKWYVPEQWRRKLKRIVDKTKRAQTRNRFYELLTQLDANLFRSRLRQFFDASDPDLEDTLIAIKACHLEEIENWSICWRLNALASTNAHVESLNRKLKYLYGKVATAKTLSSLLGVVDGYLLNECELKRKEIKGVVSYKLCDLRRRHDECLKDDVVVAIENTVDGGWYISVADARTDVADVHFVCECHDSCSGCKLYCEKCQSCAQKYRCTCPDNTLKSNMCKHIHALCMRLNGQEADKGCADLTNLLHSSSKKIVETTDNVLCNFHTCDSNKLIDILPSPRFQFEIENIETSNTFDIQGGIV